MGFQGSPVLLRTPVETGRTDPRDGICATRSAPPSSSAVRATSTSLRIHSPGPETAGLGAQDMRRGRRGVADSATPAESAARGLNLWSQARRSTRTARPAPLHAGVAGTPRIPSDGWSRTKRVTRPRSGGGMVVPKGASVPSTTCDLSLASSTAATGGTAMPPPLRQHAQVHNDERHRRPEPLGPRWRRQYRATS